MLRVLAVLGLVGFVGVNEARAERAAVVEQVETFGGLRSELARAHLERLLGAVGYRVLDETPACAGDRACLRSFLRDAGADLAVRATYVDVAGEVTLALVLIERDGRAWEITAAVAAIERVSSELVAAISAPEQAIVSDSGHAPGRRRLAWGLAAGGALAMVGGGLMIWEARSQRDEFFDGFVDGDGNVMGLSPGQAQDREDRANRWLAAGIATACVGALAGMGSTVLFITAPERGSTSLVVKGVF